MAQHTENICTAVSSSYSVVVLACRGMHCDRGVDLGKADQARENAEIVQSTASTSLVIPVEADFFVAYSTPPEYVSWLNPTLGSWFIQALVKVLNEKGTSLEINQLLTRVNHIVAYQGEAKKQMPYYTSTLTKDLYFHE
ncbi:caspase-7-like [Patiria miniata]|uniref:Caspase family p10 domain-containing protein n=1 Tax=Patiria miniata TaxID=46514 RepID=A0A914APL0_PATMI|nr:caspase-7-like [Patiria miniata]